MKVQRVILLISVVAAISAYGVHASAVAPEGKLVRVVFAHRHGAREDTHNIDDACGKIGCGELTMAGEKMLRNLGESFLHRYSSLFPKNPSTGKARFNITSMQTRSDKVTRCTQSANAFWRGLFGANEGNTTINAPHLPAIDSSWGDTVNSIAPNHELHDGNPAVEESNAYAWNKSVAEGLITFEELLPMAAELRIKKCDRTDPHDCFHKIVGFIRQALPNGISSRFPLIMEKLPVLDAVRRNVVHYDYGLYDEEVLKSGYFKFGGWPGAILMDAMLADANNSNLVLSEYSGHDTSLMPVFAALGNFSFSYPQVGTAFTLEIYEGLNKSLTVKARIAEPDQYPSSGYPISWSIYEMNCVNAAGQQYTSDTCPMDDVKRYLESRYPAGTKKGTTPSYCMAYPPDLIAMKCTPTDVKTASLKHHCGRYRHACPFEACGAGYYLVANNTCVAV